MFFLQRVDLRCNTLRETLDLCDGFSADLWLWLVVELNVLGRVASNVRNDIKCGGHFYHGISLADHLE